MEKKNFDGGKIFCVCATVLPLEQKKTKKVPSVLDSRTSAEIQGSEELTDSCSLRAIPCFEVQFKARLFFA